MPRSASSCWTAAEMFAPATGIGAGSALRTTTWTRSRTPRARSPASMSSAASYGTAGHLYSGAAVTTMIRPDSMRASSAANRCAPGRVA